MIHGRHFEDINKQEKISFRVTNPVAVNYMEKKLDITKPTLGTRGFFSRATGSFVSSGADTRFKTWPRPETAHEKPLAPRLNETSL